ncbi:hypothetical protein RFI_37625, partial [Reticulomyxa filosa]
SKDLKDRSELLIREREDLKRQRDHWQQMVDEQKERADVFRKQQEDVETRHKEVLELHRGITEERHKLHEEKKKFLKEHRKWEKEKKKFLKNVTNVETLTQPISSKGVVLTNVSLTDSNVSPTTDSTLGTPPAATTSTTTTTTATTATTATTTTTNGIAINPSITVIPNGLLPTMPMTTSLKPLSGSRFGATMSHGSNYGPLHPVSMMGGSLRDARNMAIAGFSAMSRDAGDNGSEYAESEYADTVTSAESLNSISDDEIEVPEERKGKVQYLQLPINEYE